MTGLTPTQSRLMALMLAGHHPVEVGRSVHVEGERVCGLPTMEALGRMGYVEKLTRYVWCMTPEGRSHREAK